MRHGLPLFALFLALMLAKSAIAGDLALTHAQIYPSPDADAIADGTLIIHNGRIASMGPAAEIGIPANLKVIDLQGSVVTAGYWNSHVHFMAPSILNADKHSNAELSQVLTQMFTRWGFTTVFDISSPLANTLAIRRRISAGEVVGPKKV